MQSNQPQHPFDLATSTHTPETSVYSGHTSSAYGNMIGPFGGVIASTLLRAVLEHDEILGEPIFLTTNYVAPIQEAIFSIIALIHRERIVQRNTGIWS